MYRLNYFKKMNYPALLLKSPEKIFHTQDLRVLWKISNSNTLYTTIKRYVDRQLLIPLQKGLYATTSFDRLDPLVAAFKALHGFAYISCEWVLAKHGVLNAPVTTLTFVGRASRRFRLVDIDLRCRKLDDRFLLHPVGVLEKEGYFIATIERAVADLLYFNPQAHFDAPIAWGQVRKLQIELGYPLTPDRYVSSATGR